MLQYYGDTLIRLSKLYSLVAVLVHGNYNRVYHSILWVYSVNIHHKDKNVHNTRLLMEQDTTTSPDKVPFKRWKSALNSSYMAWRRGFTLQTRTHLRIHDHICMLHVLPSSLRLQLTPRPVPVQAAHKNSHREMTFQNLPLTLATCFQCIYNAYRCIVASASCFTMCVTSMPHFL